MSLPLVQPNTCSTCGWKTGVGDALFCRRFPPTQMVRLMVNPHTKQPEEAIQSSFPKVRGEMWCGEYTRLARGAGGGIDGS